MIAFCKIKSPPVTEIGYSGMYLYICDGTRRAVLKQVQHRYEGRLSRTVPWERWGETPRRDPTIPNKIKQ